jgi:hypothetical protein
VQHQGWNPYEWEMLQLTNGSAALKGKTDDD